MPRKCFIPSFDSWLREKYTKKHKQCIKNARSLVDIEPPKSILKFNKSKECLKKAKRIHEDNIKLFNRIHYIKKHHGSTDNINHYKPFRSKFQPQMLQRERELQKSNCDLCKRISKARSLVDTRREVELGLVKKRFKAKTSISQATLKEYMEILHFKEVSLMVKLLRPKIFLDLFVKKVSPMGRIVIQLYTEACPEFVLQFVRMCARRQKSRLKFIRIFPQLWIEGEISVAQHVLNAPGFLFDMNCLDHGQSRGILSFAKSYLQGFPRGLSNFTISFKEMRLLNGLRVPFGVVSQGLKILDCLQEFGTKNGKMKKDVVVVNCGVIY
ncbi:uncharacterized protein ACRADG_001778 [Cochliomyia hominivorax]